MNNYNLNFRTILKVPRHVELMDPQSAYLIGESFSSGDLNKEHLMKFIKLAAFSSEENRINFKQALFETIFDTSEKYPHDHECTRQDILDLIEKHFGKGERVFTHKEKYANEMFKIFWLPTEKEPGTNDIKAHLCYQLYLTTRMNLSSLLPMSYVEHIMDQFKNSRFGLHVLANTIDNWLGQIRQTLLEKVLSKPEMMMYIGLAREEHITHATLVRAAEKLIGPRHGFVVNRNENFDDERKRLIDLSNTRITHVMKRNFVAEFIESILIEHQEKEPRILNLCFMVFDKIGTRKQSMVFSYLCMLSRTTDDNELVTELFELIGAKLHTESELN